MFELFLIKGFYSLMFVGLRISIQDQAMGSTIPREAEKDGLARRGTVPYFKTKCLACYESRCINVTCDFVQVLK